MGLSYEQAATDADVPRDTHDAVGDAGGVKPDSSSGSASGWLLGPVRGLSGPIPPLVAPKTVPWELELSATDFERLKTGFSPDDAEDRWIMFSEDPHPPNGDVTVKIIRIFSRVFWVLHLRRSGGSGAGTGAGGKVYALTWDQDVHGMDYSEQEAKREAVKFAKLIVDCDLDGLNE
ncbi:hypothetical protein MAPG_11970 [Magnaporthiopsis poae ATCC 64411]|uniref:Uncharacterized protein n=1 Tax=Magnaporthiopsis poae (strain ATCC 64411 / 73-15) TaxID=644358 RepID=A0A0C4EGL0_MAGP6|nr:hypothetical protein MAPG_11970 [Magnaporthiopsis poae ATCC 64411]